MIISVHATPSCRNPKPANLDVDPIALAGFLSEIAASPDDHTPRLALADWLSDHGEIDTVPSRRMPRWLSHRWIAHGIRRTLHSRIGLTVHGEIRAGLRRIARRSMVVPDAWWIDRAWRVEIAVVAGIEVVLTPPLGIDDALDAATEYQEALGGPVGAVITRDGCRLAILPLVGEVER